MCTCVRMCVRMCERTYMRVIYIIIYSKNFVFLVFFSIFVGNGCY